MEQIGYTFDAKKADAKTKKIIGEKMVIKLTDKQINQQKAEEKQQSENVLFIAFSQEEKAIQEIDQKIRFKDWKKDNGYSE